MVNKDMESGEDDEGRDQKWQPKNGEVNDDLKDGEIALKYG